MDSQGDRGGQDRGDRGRGGDKKKNKYKQPVFQQGSKRKRRDMGRQEYFRQDLNKRNRNDENQEKRQKLEEEGKTSHLPAPFSQEEIASEDRRPKRKVAVLIGYSGTGYKGMQITASEKTIEGDLFSAFVKAGAISKANADDPKKSSLVRCARTDKGVHAAGNMISLKLIIEDPNIVDKINAELSEQIRIWAIERVPNSFSCYQACDSRWYEYLIPTHSFLPPHPTSYLGKKLVELADEVGDLESYRQRQKDVEDFWPNVDAQIIRPYLETLPEEIRSLVEKALYLEPTASAGNEPFDAQALVGEEEGDVAEGEEDSRAASRRSAQEQNPTSKSNAGEPEMEVDVNPTTNSEMEPTTSGGANPVTQGADSSSTDRDPALDAAIKHLRAAYLQQKKAYRISPSRMARAQEALEQYVGTHNYHNFTVRKAPNDPSTKRHIKSFKVNPVPIIINDTEWLSLKVHGQSFMMHQIRKMVGMVALVVRCGTPIERLKESLSEKVISIPKVPGLGLLLERPVFDNYNLKAEEKFERNPLDFGKYDDAINEFKKREIYDRMFREEEEGSVFHSFFSHIDNFKDPAFLFVTSKGIPACGAQGRMVSQAAPSLSRKDRNIHSSKSGKAKGNDGDSTAVADGIRDGQSSPGSGKVDIPANEVNGELQTPETAT